VVLARSFVIGMCGGDFGVERAEVDTSAIDEYSCSPFFLFLDPIDALELGTGVKFEFSAVSDVLGECGDTEVCTSIVEAIVIDVVDEEVRGSSLGPRPSGWMSR